MIDYMIFNKNARWLPLVATLLLAACTPKSEVKIATETGTVRLQVVTPEIVRVSVSPDGKFRDRSSLMVLPQQGCKDYTVNSPAWCWPRP